ncbi:YdcF family protein [Thetidibacter halocola]|uniref:YdcF family protein n=1 Tax=Thetidibacter halocola TaxID=2827239 RepID=A0A8J8B671_9RHOB|nr:YdcF family protein [Thetidibacter halocola]MBS0123017.1 YdcF family protein [Thetidibacter halocola]
MRWLAVFALGYAGLCGTLTGLSTALVPACLRVTEPADVAIVLGAALKGDLPTGETLARIDAAIDLHDRGLVSRLHATGSRPDGSIPSAGGLMRAYAILNGVPEGAVTAENASRSTLENALFSRPALPPGETRIVVTNGYHGLRSMLSFAWAGRPASACASQPIARSLTERLRDPLRETAAWAYNLPRAALWSLAWLGGVEQRLGARFLQ